MWPQHSEFDAKTHTILLCIGGSRSYGTNNPDSDTDYRGVLVPPIEIRNSPFRNCEQILYKSDSKSGRVSEQTAKLEAEHEGVIFALQKFFNLAAKCNPNVIEILYTDPAHIVHKTYAGSLLLEGRDLFLSNRAIYSFNGYAISQLKRIDTHRKWLLDPPTQKPERKDFDLPEERLIDPSGLSAANTLIQSHLQELSPYIRDLPAEFHEYFWTGLNNILGVRYEYQSWNQVREETEDAVAHHLGMDSNFIEYVRKERKYHAAVQHYNQYLNWKANRNPDRALLESKFGYDSKHAMHLVRLLRMGEELISTGTLTVYRPDREELKAIRKGAWSYEEMQSFAKQTSEKLDVLVRNKKSALPDKPNIDALEELYRNILIEFDLPYGKSEMDFSEGIY